MKFVISFYNPLCSDPEQFVCRLHYPEAWVFTNHTALAYRFDSVEDANKRIQEVFPLQQSLGSIRIYEVST